ncbi:hypothetical protein [Kluyvera intermedia]|uniref:hypothetical protein n=1 Tax=Kluyvera intermedia TaxID=61648 RepID=UPI003523B5C1
MDNEITAEDLSLIDKDIADKIRTILAAKYGLIAVEEPILHLAVANAAALNYVTGELRQLHIKQTDEIYTAHQSFRESLSDSLLYFDKNLMNIIQKTVSEICENHIEQFRITSEKQTAQIQYIIDNRPAVAAPVTAVCDTPSAHPGINWLHTGIAALTGGTAALLAVLSVL